VPDDVRFCDECKPKPQADADDIRVHTLTDREKYAFLYSSTRWANLRALVIRSQPMCAMCRARLSVIVDHKTPAGIAIIQAHDSGKYPGRYAGFFIRSNLQGLCRECHWRKTEEDKRHAGPWPDVVEHDARTPRKPWTF
jgi:5-methylcytosine-specific restriction endonuclease McrA